MQTVLPPQYHPRRRRRRRDVLFLLSSRVGRRRRLCSVSCFELDPSSRGSCLLLAFLPLLLPNQRITRRPPLLTKSIIGTSLGCPHSLQYLLTSRTYIVSFLSQHWCFTSFFFFFGMAPPLHGLFLFLLLYNYFSDSTPPFETVMVTVNTLLFPLFSGEVKPAERNKNNKKKPHAYPLLSHGRSV